MCEIAVLDPERSGINAVLTIADMFNEEQGDGLGFVLVEDTGDAFRYNTYKSTEPHWQTVYSFLRRNWEDTWRIVIHGRAMTAGAVNRKNAHPLHVDCDCCDFDHVVHNGSVRDHGDKRERLEKNGHTFNTGVDSEVIAHQIGELPDDVDDHTRDTYNIRGNLNYLLFSEDGILVRAGRRYHIMDDFLMTCSMNKFSDKSEFGFERDTSTQFMLVKPGGNIETKGYTKKSYGSRSRSSGSAWYDGQQGNRSQQSTWNRSSPDESQAGSSEDTYTVEYTDHATEWDHVTAVKVAPGVMRVIERSTGEQSYVFRNKSPRLYYFYAPEPTPENIGELEELAEDLEDRHRQFHAGTDGDGEDGGSGNSESPERIEKQAAEAAASTVANLTVEELATIERDLAEMLEDTAA